MVATIGDTVVGYGLVVMEEKLEVENSGILKTLLFTHITKNGIGKTIVDSLFDVAKLEGCYKVSLQCQAHNIDFYEKCN